MPADKSIQENVSSHLTKYLSYRCDEPGSNVPARPGVDISQYPNSPSAMVSFHLPLNSFVYPCDPKDAIQETKTSARLTFRGRFASHARKGDNSCWIWDDATATLSGPGTSDPAIKVKQGEDIPQCEDYVVFSRIKVARCDSDASQSIVTLEIPSDVNDEEPHRLNSPTPLASLKPRIMLKAQRDPGPTCSPALTSRLYPTRTDPVRAGEVFATRRRLSGAIMYMYIHSSSNRMNKGMS